MTGIPAGTTRPVRAAEPCTRCGASGTHYLTCPSLRLPPGTASPRTPPPDARCRCGLPAGPCGVCSRPWLSWRAEQQAGQRAEYRRARDRAAPGPGAGLGTGGRPGRLCGGPDHPDWPLPPRR
jgi:hypothetical protein